MSHMPQERSFKNNLDLDLDVDFSRRRVSKRIEAQREREER